VTSVVGFWCAEPPMGWIVVGCDGGDGDGVVGGSADGNGGGR